MANQLINVMQLISSLEVGGAEKLLLDLLASCRDSDQINFTVVVMNQAVNPTMRQRLERMGLNVYFLGRPEGHLHARYLRELLRIARRHEVEIIHCHNSGSKLWAMLCKVFKPAIKLVFTVHDTVPARYSLPQKVLHRVLIDRHIAISKAVEALCEREGFHRKTQIYNGIDLLPFKNENRLSLTERLRQASFKQRPMRIVQVGRMHYPKKGQDLLVRAIHQCVQNGMNLLAILMGGVYEYSQKSYQELRELVSELGLENNIEFFVNRTDVPDVLKEADLFVLPSRYEGLGLVVLEAMAAGVPVIASNIDGPAELIQNGDNGLLFESENVSSLVEKICLLYENPDLADQLSKKASQSVQRFDIHCMRQQYYELYQELTPAKFSKKTPLNHHFESTLGEVMNGTPV